MYSISTCVLLVVVLCGLDHPVQHPYMCTISCNVVSFGVEFLANDAVL